MHSSDVIWLLAGASYAVVQSLDDLHTRRSFYLKHENKNSANDSWKIVKSLWFSYYEAHFLGLPDASMIPQPYAAG